MGISLRVLLAFLIAAVAAITAVVCFVPTYVAGFDSVISTANKLRSSLVVVAQSRVSAYFSKPLDLALLVQYANQRGRFDSTNATGMVQMMCDLALSNVGAFTAATFLSMDGVFVRCDTTNLLTHAFGGQPGVVTLSPNGSSLVAYLVDNQTHVPLYNTKYFEAALPPGIPMWGLTAASITLANDPVHTLMWSLPTVQYDSTSLIVGSSFQYPNGTFRGTVSFDIASIAVADFLKSLGLLSGGRAIAWDDNSGTTIGLSWGEAPVILLPQWQNLALPAQDRGILRQLDNFSDPLLRQVLSDLGGLAAVRQLPVPFEQGLGSGKDVVFVNIVGVSDAHGLNLKILLAMPQIDFVRSVYDQQSRTIAGVVCGAVAMIVVAFICGHLIGQPLSRLAARMRLTASFEDYEENDPPSVLSEVASMQASYSLMKDQLNRAKTYLPQSVITKGDDDDDEEDAREMDGADRSRGERSRGASMAKSRSETLSVTPSNSARVSRRSTQNLVAAGGVGGLNTALGLALRNVSVVAFNLRGFMRTAASSGRSCSEMQELMLTTVQRIVREQKGVVDYFQGDRVLASFNAVTNAMAHAKRAATAAAAAIRELQVNPSMSAAASAGISSGMALCGNMGTSDMRRFCIVGHPVTQALLLERMTKLYSGVAMLMPGWMETEVSLEFVCEALDIVKLPGGGPKLNADDNRRHCVILAVRGKKSVQSDEWMYELKEGEQSNPFLHVNVGFAALAAGDMEKASAEAAAAVESAVTRDTAGYQSLQQHLANANANDKRVVPSELALHRAFVDAKVQ